MLVEHLQDQGILNTCLSVIWESMANTVGTCVNAVLPFKTKTVSTCNVVGAITLHGRISILLINVVHVTSG